MSTQPMHKHLVDGKEILYHADTCPLCNPEQATALREEPVAKVYLKNVTCVVQPRKSQLMTIHWWKDGNAFLISSKRMQRDHRGNRMLDVDGNVEWEQMTFRLNKTMMKKFIGVMTDLIVIAEGVKGVPQRE